MKVSTVSMSLLCLALGAGCASVERNTARLDEDLDAITRVWSGEFAGEATVPPEGEVAAIFHRIVSIQAPQFGDRVFFYQLCRDDVDGPILQQKIFAFDTDPLRTANRMRAWVLSREQFDPAFAATPANWRRLLPNQLMSFPEACAFRWRETKGGYAGSVSAKECEFDSRAFGQPVRPDMSYEISAAALVWTETLSAADGTVLASTDGSRSAQRIGPIIDVRRNYYDVQGMSAMEIRRDLYARSPVFAHGDIRDAQTDWIVAWEIDWSESETGCRVDGVSTTVEISYLLPRLQNWQSLPAELRAEWDDYMDALLRHELRHHHFAVDAARKIESVLSDLREHDTCDAAAEEAERIAGNVIQTARRRERQYDDTTRYGVAEGAELPRL